jgi:S-adenosylmethionine:tRNA ribosyltransferase-isomerase
MAAADLIADFELPAALEAAEPPEARGLRRDDVRLLVSDLEADSIEHARFTDLPRWLSPGDLIVVNTSGTLNAALVAQTPDGKVYEIHLSTQLPGGFWSVEVRQPDHASGGASVPCHDARSGMQFELVADGTITLLAPYPLTGSLDGPSRLWMAALAVPGGVVSYLEAHGFPIRYGYVTRAWPPAMYKTVFATEPGSAEMPSAARPFTHELVTRLISKGIEIAPLLLHTGVASLESHEPPYEEYFRVPRLTAERVTSARRAGRRVIAVGTTVVRALETVTDDSGQTVPGEGWTSLVITPDRALRSVTGLITGLHEPRATHLAMLERVASRVQDGRPCPCGGVVASACGRCHLQRAYTEALRQGYLWHEFGDSHLILSSCHAR